jgi:hypothetical protein
MAGFAKASHERTYALAQRAADVAQSTGPQHEQQDRQHDDQVDRLE